MRPGAQGAPAVPDTGHSDIPPTDGSQEPSKKPSAELEALRWLFLIVLGVALTNGTRIFWTGSLASTPANTLPLRPWSTLFTSLDSLYFLAFVAEVVITALGGVFLLHSDYGSSETTLRAPRLVWDAFVFVTIGILFNGVSFTLERLPAASSQFFGLFGTIFALQFGFFVFSAIDALRDVGRLSLVDRSTMRGVLWPQVWWNGIRLAVPLLASVIVVLPLYFGILHYSTDFLLFAVAGDVVLGGLALANLWARDVFDPRRIAQNNRRGAAPQVQPAN